MEARLYLILDIIIFLGPLTRAFEPRIRYIDLWPRLLAATLVVMAIFLPWDIAFTHQGIWGFTPKYLIPWDFMGLPLEEVLLFLVVPWACYFIYEVLQLFFYWDRTSRPVYMLTIAAAIGCIALAMKNGHHAYTFWTFLLLGGGLGVAGIWRPYWLSAFYRAYAVSLIPFFLVNGILTGSYLDEPIVWYAASENLGIRIGTIPLEDGFYSMFMMLVYTTIVQWNKHPKSST